MPGGGIGLAPGGGVAMSSNVVIWLRLGLDV
jgi:hypothetical protein